MYLKQKIWLSFLIVLVTILVFHKSVFAQSAAIEGTVIDSVTKAPLPSANIILKGTSIGTASSDDGEFALKNIPPGTYTIKTTYVGYRTNEFKIALKANKTLKTIIKLNPASIEGKTVTVTSQAIGQYEAINKQLNSDQIENRQTGTVRCSFSHTKIYYTSKDCSIHIRRNCFYNFYSSKHA